MISFLTKSRLVGRLIQRNFLVSNEKLGCPENAKSLKSQAPQGFSGCLDIDNDEMNKKIF